MPRRRLDCHVGMHTATCLLGCHVGMPSRMSSSLSLSVCVCLCLCLSLSEAQAQAQARFIPVGSWLWGSAPSHRWICAFAIDRSIGSQAIRGMDGWKDIEIILPGLGFAAMEADITRHYARTLKKWNPPVSLMLTITRIQTWQIKAKKENKRSSSIDQTDEMKEMAMIFDRHTWRGLGIKIQNLKSRGGRRRRRWNRPESNLAWTGRRRSRRRRENREFLHLNVCVEEGTETL